jgi:signal peptidase I
MTKKNTPPPENPSEAEPPPVENKVEETPYEAVASICSVLVVGLFILTFLGQNFVIPSGSMENTLLIGDHLVVDRITLAPPTMWMPLVHYREPKRNDVVVFLKPVADSSGNYLFLVKRLIGVPGDHIHLRNGIVIINGVAQDQPHAQAPHWIIIPTFSTSSPLCLPSRRGPMELPRLGLSSFPASLRMAIS